MNKIAFITGATSGIGKATAQKMAINGYDIIITGRRKSRLEAFAQQLTKKGINVFLIDFDIRSLEECENAVNNLPDKWRKIDVLINNAGLAAGLDPIQNGSISDWEQMIDTNIKGLLYISRKIMPEMIKRKSGHIVNISSIAGKEVYAKGNVYCATKHAVEALTKAMRVDLLEYNIKVTSIAPGAAETEFSMVRFKGDKKKAGDVYKDYIPLYAEDVAEAVIFVVTRPPHVNINQLVLTATAQANSFYIHRQPEEE